jgi:hypothetical protein
VNYELHQALVAAVRAAADANGWPVWIEPDFFGADTWKVVRRDGRAIVLVAEHLSLLAAIEAGATVGHTPPPAPHVLTAKEQQVLDAITALGRPCALGEVTSALGGHSKDSISRHIRTLVASGHVIAEGATRARRYRLASVVQESPQPGREAVGCREKAPGEGQAESPVPVALGRAAGSPAAPDDEPGAVDELPGAPEPIAPPLDPVSPRVRREMAREDAERARTAAAGTPPVDPVLRRRIGLYFDAPGRTDTLEGISARVNLTGDVVRPTLRAMLAAGAIEPVPGATPIRYRRAA